MEHVYTYMYSGTFECMYISVLIVTCVISYVDVTYMKGDWLSIRYIDHGNIPY